MQSVLKSQPYNILLGFTMSGKVYKYNRLIMFVSYVICRQPRNKLLDVLKNTFFIFFIFTLEY